MYWSPFLLKDVTLKLPVLVKYFKTGRDFRLIYLTAILVSIFVLVSIPF